MKKLLCGICSVSILGTCILPVVTQSLIAKEIPSNYPYGEYKDYQTENDWENYLLSKSNLINALAASVGLNNYKYKSTNLAFKSIDNQGNVIGDILINGKFKSSIGEPIFAGQHIVDNTNGTGKMEISYKGFSRETTSTISITNAHKDTLNEKITIGFKWLGFKSETKIGYEYNHSKTETHLESDQINFDNFNATLDPGKREEIDYFIMSNHKTINAIFKTQIDTENSSFVFTNGNNQDEPVSWDYFLKNESEITFDNILYGLNNYSGFDEPFFTINKIYKNDSTVYNSKLAYIYLPLVFDIDGYTTYITSQFI